MSTMVLTASQIHTFRTTVLEYYRNHGRHTLPWRTTHISPYHVLVSEIMLQQTSVERVTAKFLDFCRAFPSIHALAGAPQSEVISRWVGLGYNRRAVYLHRTAQEIVATYSGIVPDRREVLITLPGIGPYAAASIAAFAYDRPEIVIDTNIRSIYIEHFFPDQDKISDQELFPYIEETLYRESPRIWYSALMDYGVYLKKTVGNITQKSTQYARQSSFAGSRRQIRGAVVRMLSDNPVREKALIDVLVHTFGSAHNIRGIVQDLEKENIIKKMRDTYTLV